MISSSNDKQRNLRRLQEGKDEYMILDVREADELQEGKIDGAVNIPLGQLIRKARHGDIDRS